MTVQNVFGDIGLLKQAAVGFLAPTSPAQITSQTCQLGKVQVAVLTANLEGNAYPTITIYDGQDTPIAAMNARPPQAGLPLIVDFGGRIMPGGISVVCDTPNAVSVYVEFSIPQG